MARFPRNRVDLASEDLTYVRCTATKGHHLCMGSYGGLYVGGVQVASIKNQVWPELLSVFTDSMYGSRIAEAAEFYVDTEPGATVTAHEFTARGQIIADRLDVLGFTPDQVYHALDSRLDQARHLRDFPLWESTNPEWIAGIEAERAYLEAYTAHDWIADLRSAAASPAEDSRAPGPSNGSCPTFMKRTSGLCCARSCWHDRMTKCASMLRILSQAAGLTIARLESAHPVSTPCAVLLLPMHRSWSSRRQNRYCGA